MSDTQDGESLIRMAEEAGVELFLWKRRVCLARNSDVPPKLRADLLRHSDKVRAALARRYVLERSEPRRPHKWVIRLGDDPKSTNPRPAYLACGPIAWYDRLIRQASMIASEEEAVRWLVLDQDRVGALADDDRGVQIATVVILPEGRKLGGPKGAPAEVISVCDACATPPIETSVDKDD